MKKAQKKSNPAKNKSGRKPARHTQLEKSAAAYFASLSGETLEKEKRLEAAVGEVAFRVNFDE
jgi:hypothetical protein